MRGDHQNDGDQRNVGSYHFLAHDIALLLQCRITLDSSAVHALDVTFKILAAHHGHLLLGRCHAGAHAPISEETRLEGLYSAHAIDGWSRCRVRLHSRLLRGGEKRTGETPRGLSTTSRQEREGLGWIEFVRGSAGIKFCRLPLKSALVHKWTPAVLMPEVAHLGEDHGEAGVVGSGDHLVVAQRAAGLDHGLRARIGDHLQTIGKGEEGV
jgi:hypothetical protein